MRGSHTSHILNQKESLNREKNSTTDGDRQGEREAGITCATMNESDGTGPREAWSDGSTYKERIHGAKRKTTDG
jgi:hypothetical protein